MTKYMLIAWACQINIWKTINDQKQLSPTQEIVRYVGQFFSNWKKKKKWADLQYFLLGFLWIRYSKE